MDKTIVDYNGMDIVINHKDYDSFINELRKYYDTYINEAQGHGNTEENGLRIYNYEDDESSPTGSLETIEEEFNDFEDLINQLWRSTEKYKTLLSKIGTKKNGKFRKKAYVELKRTLSATTPENEFTSSWGMYVLRLQAISEGEVELYFKYEYL